jgi:hypothetical protein
VLKNNHIKKVPTTLLELFYIFLEENYIAAVVAAALSLQHPPFLAFVSFTQQVLDFAHFFLFFLPPSANAILVTINAAVANKNTFFIVYSFKFLLIRYKNIGFI